MRESAGILLFRIIGNNLQFLLAHPGGPVWKNKDIGAWTIPKGELNAGEDILEAAKREFYEETGFIVRGNFIKLTPVKQKSGKLVHAWAVEGDVDPETIKSNTFSLQWPPNSGKWIDVPEIDRCNWFSVTEAKLKLNPAQTFFVDELMRILQTTASTVE